MSHGVLVGTPPTLWCCNSWCPQTHCTLCVRECAPVPWLSRRSLCCCCCSPPIPPRVQKPGLCQRLQASWFP